MDNNDTLKFQLKKRRLLLTGPISGYVSEHGRIVIKRLTDMGYDPDLAFEMAAASIPEEDFYDLEQGEE